MSLLQTYMANYIRLELSIWSNQWSLTLTYMSWH